MTLVEAIDTFLSEPFSVHTKRYRARYLARFIASVGNGPVIDVDIRAVTLFRQSLSTQTKSTQRETMRTIRAFFGWLARATDLPCLKPERITVPRAESKPFTAVTESEIEHLRQVIGRQDGERRRLRDQAAFEVMYCTGFRRQEVQRITPRDVDWPKGSITVLGKFSKSVRGLLSPDAERALRAHIAVSSGLSVASPLFPQSPNWLHERFRLWGRWAGLTKCHPHMLRKACGTMFYRKTKDIELTRKLLNHDQVETTQRYLCLGEEELRAAHEFVFGNGEHFSVITEHQGKVVLQASVYCVKGLEGERIKAAIKETVENLLRQRE